MITAGLFKDKMTNAGYTIETTANKLGINITTLYRKMNGKSDFYRTEIELISEIFNLSSIEKDVIFFGLQLTQTQDISNKK